jgi:hypothetical protein
MKKKQKPQNLTTCAPNMISQDEAGWAWNLRERYRSGTNIVRLDRDDKGSFQTTDQATKRCGISQRRNGKLCRRKSSQQHQVGCVRDKSLAAQMNMASVNGQIRRKRCRCPIGLINR